MEDGIPGDVLKAVFPLLDGKELASCMLVCRQWRGIARDDYYWKCICARKWSSICKTPPHGMNYHKFYLTFSKQQETQPLPVPRLSFEDLVFYIDMWHEGSLIFSEAVSGCILRAGLKDIPQGIPDVLMMLLTMPSRTPDCILMLQVEPRLTIPMELGVTVSVFANRKDTNKMACIMNKSTFDSIDNKTAQILAYEYLRFSLGHPFISDIRAWMSLMFLYKGTNVMEVFGIEIDFCDDAKSENEILWLLDMLDWK